MTVEPVVDALNRIEQQLSPHGLDATTISNIVLSVLSLVVSGIGIFFAWRATILSRQSIDLARDAIQSEGRSERQSRGLDTQLDCQRRYGDLEDQRLDWRYADPQRKEQILNSAEPGIFFRSFWTLKSDQFEFWLAGNIDYHTFIGWTLSTARHLFHDNDHDWMDRFFAHSFAAGWAQYGRPYHIDLNPLFTRFTDALYHQFYRSGGTLGSSFLAPNLPSKLSDAAIDTLDNMLSKIEDVNIVNEDTGIARRFGYIETPAGYRTYRTLLRSRLPDLLVEYLPAGYDPRVYGGELQTRHPLTRRGGRGRGRLFGRFPNLRLPRL